MQLFQRSQRCGRRAWGVSRQLRRGARAAAKLRLELLEDRRLMSVDVSGTIEGISNTGYQPPDPTGAAGYNHIVEVVNATMAAYDKTTGARVMQQGLGTLFAPLGGVASLGDPVITFDEYTGQFIIGVLDYNPSARLSRFDVAFSNDSDPRDGFYLQRYNMDDGTGGFDFADYPKIGYNQDAYVFSFNMFPNLQSYSHVNTLAIDKNTLQGYRVAVPGGASHFTLAPTVMHSSNPGDPMWLVEAGGSTTMRVAQMNNILSTSPTFSFTSISVPSYGSAPRPTQPGGAMNWSFDTCVINAAYNYGYIVAGHTVGIGGVARARWYIFDTNPGTPYLYQSGNIAPASSVHTYFPSLEMNYNGDVGITYMESSPSEYVSMYVAGRSSGDPGPLQPMQAGVATHPGGGPYGSSRAGDYSGISVDPNDGYTFWAVAEYRGTAAWNTGIASFGVSPSAGGAPGRSGRNLHFVGILGSALLAESAPATAIMPETISPTIDNSDLLLIDNLLEAASTSDGTGMAPDATRVSRQRGDQAGLDDLNQTWFQGGGKMEIPITN